MAFSDSNNNNKGASSMAELETQIAELRSQVAALTENIAAFGSAKMDDYKASFESMAQEALASSMKAMGQVKKDAISLEKDFEMQVRDHPLRSVGVAVGVGFLVALLMRRG